MSNKIIFGCEEEEDSPVLGSTPNPREITPDDNDVLKILLCDCIASMKHSGLIFKIDTIDGKVGDTVTFTITVPNTICIDCKCGYDLACFLAPRNKCVKGGVSYIDPSTGVMTFINQSMLWDVVNSGGFTTYTATGVLEEEISLTKIFVNISLPDGRVKTLFTTENDDSESTKCVPFNICYTIIHSPAMATTTCLEDPCTTAPATTGLP